MSGQVIAAAWASPAPVENPHPRPGATLPAGVVHLRKPLEPNPAPNAYAAAIAYMAAALPPAAFARATQAALHDYAAILRGGHPEGRPAPRPLFICRAQVESRLAGRLGGPLEGGGGQRRRDVG